MQSEPSLEVRRTPELDVAFFAHDLRNLLATVLGHAELQLEGLAKAAGGRVDVAELGQSLQAISRTAHRAVSLCQDLQSLNREAIPSREPVPVAEVARRATRLFEDRSGGILRCELDGPEDLMVTANRNGLERALLNLLWNAQDALGERDDVQGRVCLRWGRGRRSAWIEVADNGPGLPSGAIAPGAGRGPLRGLGLQAVAAILHEHGGRLRGRNDAESGGAVLRIDFGVQPELHFEDHSA